MCSQDIYPTAYFPCCGGGRRNTFGGWRSRCIRAVMGDMYVSCWCRTWL